MEKTTLEKLNTLIGLKIMGFLNFATTQSPIVGSVGTPTTTSVSVTTTTISALPSNTNRKKAVIYSPPSNTSIIYLCFGATATVANGIAIGPNQGWSEEGNEIYQGQFSAICNTGGSGNLIVTEWQ